MSEEIMSRTAVWKGLNRMPYIEDGELRSMKNLSSDAYPFLSTRKGREEHKVSVYVPGVPGDGYLMDVTELPDASLDYAEEIVKLTNNPTESTFVAGEYYNNISGEWVQGLDNADYKGAVKSISNEYKTEPFKDEKYPYDSDNEYRRKHENHIYKYVGENNDVFEKGKTYQYKINVEPYWKKTTKGTGSGYKELGYFENIEDIPEPTEKYIAENAYFVWWGETTDKWESGAKYMCYIKGEGCWKEIQDVYQLAKDMTKATGNVRYVGNYFGSTIPKAYYICSMDYFEGNPEYFYVKEETYGGEYTVLTELPEAAEENYGKVFYSGTEADKFYKCVWDNANKAYKWEETEKPIVEKQVPFKELVTDHLSVGLTKIYEIGQLNGKLAVLFKDGSGEMQLYYEQKLFKTKDVSETPGKKLQTMGNKLIVGENGSYLYREKETNELKLYPVANKFSKTIVAESIEYAPDRYKHSTIETEYYEEGTVKLVLYSKNGEGYKDVYEGLVASDTDGGVVNFKFEINGNVFYVQTIPDKVTYEAHKEIGGTTNRTTYADVLTIYATGMPEPFSWSSEKSDANISLASTTSYLPDVEVWKKRLWGYTENYLQGTVQDVFGEKGEIDWVAGDNTQTEAISQPIWQGGNITGLAALSEALILFKEDSLTVFTGNYPAIMQASTIPARGLIASDRESVAVANEYVYYMSSDGVYRFGGGAPYSISSAAKIKGTEAVGASNGSKYWLSLKEDSGKYALYVYDIALGLWHKEDDTKAVSFVPISGRMYMATDTQILKLDTNSEAVEWEAEFWFDEGTHLPKKYKKFVARGNLGECEVWLKADDEDWQLYLFTDNKLDVRTEPVWARELSVKIKGKGVCELKSLDRIYEVVE